MADIVLKDGSGEETVYRGIRTVTLPTENGGTQTFEIPGAKPEECGNYLDQNLPMANYLANKYLNEVLDGITEDSMKYPE